MEHKLRKCPNCGNNEFVVSESSFNALPYASTDEEGKASLHKGKFLPVLAYICNECSYISFFKKTVNA